MATAAELVQRLRDVALPLADGRQHDDSYQLLAEGFNKRGIPHGGLAASGYVDEELKQLRAVADGLVNAFGEVKDSTDFDDAIDVLAQLKEAVLERFDSAASSIRKLRDRRIRSALEVPEAFTSADDRRAAVRQELTARLDVTIGKAKAEIARDARIYRRTRRTSLLVAACGVLLSTAIVSTSQFVSRRSDRRYEAREAVSRDLLPILGPLREAVYYTSWVGLNKLNRQELIRLADLYKGASAPLFSTSGPTQQHLLTAYSPAVAARFDTLVKEVRFYGWLLDSAAGTAHVPFDLRAQDSAMANHDRAAFFQSPPNPHTNTISFLVATRLVLFMSELAGREP